MRFLHAVLAVLLATSILVPLAFALAPQGRSQKKPDQKQQPAPPPDDQQQQQQPAQQQDQPKPVLSGNVSVVARRQPKDQSSQGFKGVDPAGKVDVARLNTPPTGDDTNKVLQMSVYVVSQSELDAFIKEGKLKSGTAVAR
ncbi:MAG TPA: hypothetical protein VFA60_07845 [Terriglobales bacterium]|nr:hypothetical protein [Terriglobales bacterium]